MIISVHIVKDLDSAAACWTMAENMESEVKWMSGFMSRYPDKISGYDEVFLFGTNQNKEELQKLCTRNRKVHAWMKTGEIDKTLAWGDKPPNLYPLKIVDSYCNTICYKLKLPYNRMIECIDRVSRNERGMHLDRVLEYLKLGIPYDPEHFKNASEIINRNYVEAVNIGYGIKLELEHARRDLVKCSDYILFENKRGLILNCTTDYRRSADNLSLAATDGLGITWRCVGRGTFYFSLSTINNYNLDCRSLVEKYDGSGTEDRCEFKVSTIKVLKSILSNIHGRKGRGRDHNVRRKQSI